MNNNSHKMTKYEEYKGKRTRKTASGDDVATQPDVTPEVINKSCL